MITILKPGYHKIISLFYRDKSRKLHLREIARQSHLHEPSTTRFLRTLEKENILKSEKDANLKKYSIKKNKQTYAFFTLFDLERVEKLPLLRKDALNIFLENLLEKPIFIILFGSTAKETYSENSDIDLLLIVNKKIETEKAEQEVDALTSMKISIFQITFKQFIPELKLKKDKVIQSAINTGYPLLNHIYYYEMLYNERI